LKGSLLGYLPCPLPAEFMTGFDDQKIDAEGIPARFLKPDDPTATELLDEHAVLLRQAIPAQYDALVTAVRTYNFGDALAILRDDGQLSQTA
jgi:hypothetical protein